MSVQRALIAFVMVLLVSLTGCNKDDDSGKVKGENPSDLSGMSKRERALDLDKWNSYVDLSGEYESVVLDYVDDYFKHFDEEYVKPEGAFNYRHNIRLSRPNMDALAAAAISNAGKAPQTDFDKLALTYAESLKALWAAAQAAEEYYGNKQYVDDGHAKGPELHSALMTAYDAWDSASDSFYEVMEKMGVERRALEYEEMRKEGMDVRAAMINMIIQGRRLADELERQNIPDEGVVALDLAAFRPVYDAMSAAQKELEERVADRSQLKKNGLPESDSKRMTDAAKEYKRRAAGFLDKAQNGEKIYPGCMCTPKDIAKAFDSVSNHFNSAVTK